MSDLTKMSIPELKQYLSKNRSNDDKFSEALAELLKRDPNPVIYSKDMPFEEQEQIFMAKITKNVDHWIWQAVADSKKSSW